MSIPKARSLFRNRDLVTVDCKANQQVLALTLSSISIYSLCALKTQSSSSKAEIYLAARYKLAKHGTTSHKSRVGTRGIWKP